jgi:hypothetical protein
MAQRRQGLFPPYPFHCGASVIIKKMVENTEYAGRAVELKIKAAKRKKKMTYLYLALAAILIAVCWHFFQAP